jgi:hypothetical protein
MDATDEGAERATPAPVEYNITIKGEGLTLERSIPEPTALQVLAIVMGGSTGLIGSPLPAAASPGAYGVANQGPPDRSSTSIGGHVPVASATAPPPKRSTSSNTAKRLNYRETVQDR